MKLWKKLLPLAGWALGCGALAWLWQSASTAALSELARKGLVLAIALAMVRYGVALFPMKLVKMPIMRWQTLAGGSLLLFTAAAIILASLAKGCHPLAASRTLDSNQEFCTVINGQGSGASSALTPPFPMKRNDAEQSATKKLSVRPERDLLGGRASDRNGCVAQERSGAWAPDVIDRRPEPAANHN